MAVWSPFAEHLAQLPQTGFFRTCPRSEEPVQTTTVRPTAGTTAPEVEGVDLRVDWTQALDQIQPFQTNLLLAAPVGSEHLRQVEGDPEVQVTRSQGLAERHDGVRTRNEKRRGMLGPASVFHYELAGVKAVPHDRFEDGVGIEEALDARCGAGEGRVDLDDIGRCRGADQAEDELAELLAPLGG